MESASSIVIFVIGFCSCILLFRACKPRPTPDTKTHPPTQAQKNTSAASYNTGVAAGIYKKDCVRERASESERERASKREREDGGGGGRERARARARARARDTPAQPGRLLEQSLLLNLHKKIKDLHRHMRTHPDRPWETYID
jgi:hypothetical protein